MAVLPIRVYPDPVLRVECPPVSRFDTELAGLVENMIETVHAAPGIGLAAPQVGVEQRVAVVDLSVGEDPDSLVVLINPEIVAHAGQVVDTEGCLSIPDFTEKVSRAESVTVRASTVDGAPLEIDAEDLLARVIQHEIDHLDGVLFVDHLRGLRREKARRFLRRVLETVET